MQALMNFKFKFPFPPEILDRPDLLFPLPAPCFRAGGSRRPLISRLHSAEAVNLFHLLCFAHFNVFSCL